MSSLGLRSQRAPSPSNTIYSGISNYKSKSYHRLGYVPAVPAFDSCGIAKIHFDEFQIFLGEHLAKEPLNFRSSAREKPTRPTKQQFQELSTDVYDELVRRNNNTLGNEVPFLPVRGYFHPKRNQARQKFATLPKTRFKDLAGDVFFELGRRYPEFKEPETPLDVPASPMSNYDDVSSPDFRFPQPPPLLPTSSAYSPSTYFPGPDSRRKPSREQNSPFPTTPTDRRRPSQDQNPFPATPTDRISHDDSFDRNSSLCLDGRIIRLGDYAIEGGGYADVWQGSFGTRMVAIKVTRPFGSTGMQIKQSKLLKRLWREYLVWSSLSHANILQCLGFSYDFSQRSFVPSLISPWMSNGTVLAYLEKYPDTDRLELLLGIADGLSYLHSRNPAIVHGDIRAGNVLVSDSGVPCINDFGLSRILSEVRGMTTSSEPGGSVRWMAPELLNDDKVSVFVVMSGHMQ